MPVPSPPVVHTDHAAIDGVRLAQDCYQPNGAPTLLFAHGFGQTRQAWSASAAALAARGCRCVTFDARGHGQSDPSPGHHYVLEQFVSDLAGLAQAQPAPPILVGASMGGLLGLALAGERQPAPFAALVLVDITPRWEPAGVQRVLRFMRAYPDGFVSFAEAAEAVGRYLPHRKQPKSRQRLQSLLRETSDGRLHWHWDPAMLEPIAEQGARSQARLLDAARRVSVPVLLLSGERSDVVSAETVHEFLRLVPQAKHVEVAGATHMLAGDAHDVFTHEIERFVQSVRSPQLADLVDPRYA